jgi:hypothetical protein
MSIERQVIIDWDDALTYADELMPAATTLGQNSVSGVGQKMPGLPQFRVSSFKIKPHHDDAANSGVDTNGVLAHELAKVDITYEIPGVGALPDTSGQPINYDPKEMLSHQMTGGGQFLTFEDSGGLVWDADGKRVPSGTVRGIFVPTIEHTIVDHIVESPNWAALDGKMGQLNNATFRLRGADDEKETLQYLGYDSKQVTMSFLGTRFWEISVKISRKKVTAADVATWGSSVGGHNHYWDEQNQGFFRIRKSAAAQGGASMFETFNFATLFQAGNQQS